MQPLRAQVYLGAMAIKGYTAFPIYSTAPADWTRVSRICSRSLSILCAIIVVFLARNFQNLDLAIELDLRCEAIDLELLKDIASRSERVDAISISFFSNFAFK